MLTYAEFCAGIGGFSAGIKQSNLDAKLVYANEINLSCQQTFAHNWGYKVDSEDIFKINLEDIPNFDMLCAGFPCQPFSQAGKGLGFMDERGTVFFQLMKIIKHIEPKIVFLENVPNLLKHNQGKTYLVIKNELESAGYTVNTNILNSTFFGIPQSRPRVYIVAISREICKKNQFTFTEKITEKTPLRSFLNLGDHSIPISNRWEEYIDLYTGKKSPKEITFKLPKTRVKLERIESDCDLNDCVFQIRSSGIRAISLNSPYPTFAVSNSGGGAMIPVLSKERRHLNLIEMRRIMGFPDTFYFPGSRTDAIKQLANAVCPPVIASICNDIKRFLDINDFCKAK